MAQQGNNAIVPRAVDLVTLDLVEKIKAQGFGPQEIVFMTMKADIDVNCRNRKEFMAKLVSDHGIDFSYERISKLERDPKFQECVNWLFTIEQGDMIRAVKKNLYRRAADPRDPHAIAAARLVLQMHGEIGKGKTGGGEGGGEGSYGKFIEEFRAAQREGRKITIRERTRSLTIDPTSEKTLLPESGAEPSTVIQGNFTTTVEREDPDPSEAERDSGDPES